MCECERNGWLVLWLVGWLVGWLVDWLVCWMVGGLWRETKIAFWFFRNHLLAVWTSLYMYTTRTFEQLVCGPTKPKAYHGYSSFCRTWLTAILLSSLIYYGVCLP